MTETTSTGRVGFIGLGIMGRPMAGNLLRGGFRLTVCSRRRASADQLVAEGATFVRSPGEVASASDIVITMLPGAAEVDAVLFGREGVLDAARPGQLVIDMSSVDPEDARRFAQRLGDAQVEFLDAPVSGGEVGAREGSLSIMVGGSDASFDRAMPVLSAVGRSVVHVGETGAGQIAKACNQLVVLSNIQAVAEALVLAERAGADPGRVRRALLGGFAHSRVLEVHGERMLRGDFQPGGRSELHLKDAKIVRELAHRQGVALPSFEAAAKTLEALVASGGGGLDHAALYTVVREAVLGPGAEPE